MLTNIHYFLCINVMKKLISMMLVVASVIFAFSSCSEEEIFIPQEVEFALDYTFVESGSMTRATGEEVYSSFYNKYIKTKQLTPSTYSLTFTNKETGETAIINGRWDCKDAIRLMEGEYEVNGYSTPICNNAIPSDTVSLIFNQTLNLTKETNHITLTAAYKSFLLLFDKKNSSKIKYSTRLSWSGSPEGEVYSDDNIYWLFFNDVKYNHNNNQTSFYIKVYRLDGLVSAIYLENIPFEKGKYYYFNDMTNSFDIPKMESGN